MTIRKRQKLLKELKHWDSSKRIVAAFSLCTMGKKSEFAIPSLIEALQDCYEPVRYLSLKAIYNTNHYTKHERYVYKIHRSLRRLTSDSQRIAKLVRDMLLEMVHNSGNERRNENIDDLF